MRGQKQKFNESGGWDRYHRRQVALEQTALALIGLQFLANGGRIKAERENI